MSVLTGEWVIHHSNAKQRRVIHYWLTIVWLTIGLGTWIVLRQDLWFVGFMSLYAIWITHLAGWAAETPVESERRLATYVRHQQIDPSGRDHRVRGRHPILDPTYPGGIPYRVRSSRTPLTGATPKSEMVRRPSGSVLPGECGKGSCKNSHFAGIFMGAPGIEPVFPDEPPFAA